MDEVENIGKKLKQLRTERDLTLDMVVYSMSQEYNIEFTKGNLSRWENGINLPSLRLAAYLAKFYGVSLDYLIGNTDVRTPTKLLAIKKKKGE